MASSRYSSYRNIRLNATTCNHCVWMTIQYTCTVYCPSHAPVLTNFRRYICNISINRAQNHIDHLRVKTNSEAKFQFDSTTGKIFPIDPHCKNRPLSTLSDLNEIWHQSSSNDRDKFKLDRAKSKNNIAENSFGLGHETDTSSDR